MAKKQKKASYLRKEKIVIGGIFAGIIAALAGFVIFQIISSNFYVKYNGEKLPLNQLKLLAYQYKDTYEMMYGISDWDMDLGEGQTLMMNVLQSASNDLITHHVEYNEAVARGITLTQEETDAIPGEVRDYKEYMSEAALKDINITDTELADFINRMKIGAKLREQIQSTYEFDPVEFASYFENYLVENRQSVATVMVEYIIAETVEEAYRAQDRLLGGENYETVFKEMSIDYTDETEIAPKSVVDLGFPEDALSEAFTLEVGGTPVEPFEAGGGFATYVVREVIEPNLDELTPKVQEEFTNNGKNAVYQAEFEIWMEKANPEVNWAKVMGIKFPADTLVNSDAPADESGTETPTDDLSGGEPSDEIIDPENVGE